VIFCISTGSLWTCLRCGGKQNFEKLSIFAKVVLKNGTACFLSHVVIRSVYVIQVTSSMAGVVKAMESVTL